ncbi:hypothetical protein TW86_03765 [Halomonas sp. S2151]|uniref:hypothetical protein n=1 Tax=Halomonas sp. S2151 TaxID=579478 RepID=UPI0005FA4B3E|nr:hypothetical protein [Halomonas sp. S2151]KJZ17383.1 hypothetical protein TW86_03765 [Halomonas sp. S2151]
MADAQQQLTELDNLFDGVDALDALDLDFETEEVEAAPDLDENEALEAAQAELAAEEEAPVVEEEIGAELAELLAEDEEEAPAAEVEEEDDLEAIEREARSAERKKRLEEATLTDEEIEASKSKAPTAAAKPKASTESKPKAVRDAIDVGAVIDEKVKPTTDHWVFLDGADGAATRDEILLESMSLPKKIREKVVNLMDWHVRGSKLSVYTQIGFELLLEEKTLSTMSLRNRYMSNPGKSYSLGTANAQAGQIMKLFRTFRIINAAGDVDPDHKMLRTFEAHYGA